MVLLVLCAGLWLCFMLSSLSCLLAALPTLSSCPRSVCLCLLCMLCVVFTRVCLHTWLMSCMPALLLHCCWCCCSVSSSDGGVTDSATLPSPHACILPCSTVGGGCALMSSHPPCTVAVPADAAIRIACALQHCCLMLTTCCCRMHAPAFHFSSSCPTGFARHHRHFWEALAYCACCSTPVQ